MPAAADAPFRTLARSDGRLTPGWKLTGPSRGGPGQWKCAFGGPLPRIRCRRWVDRGQSIEHESLVHSLRVRRDGLTHPNQPTMRTAAILYYLKKEEEEPAASTTY